MSSWDNEKSSVKQKFSLLGAIVLLGGYALPDNVRADAASEPVGRLKVYSETEQRSDGDNTYRYIHTGYIIYSADGTVLRKIHNEPFPLDENPEEVSLPQGRYLIDARSDLHGAVRLEVVIRTGRTASLHLERQEDWNLDLASINEKNLIKLPSSEVIGCYN